MISYLGVTERKVRRPIGGLGRRKGDEFIQSSDDSGSSNEGDQGVAARIRNDRDNGSDVERATKEIHRSKHKKGDLGGSKRQRGSHFSSRTLKPKKLRSSVNEEGLSAKQRPRIVSKAIISDSSGDSSSSSEDELRETTRKAIELAKALDSDNSNESDEEEPRQNTRKTATHSGDMADSSELSDIEEPSRFSKSHVISSARKKSRSSGRERGQKKWSKHSRIQHSDSESSSNSRAADSSDETSSPIARHERLAPIKKHALSEKRKDSPGNISQNRRFVDKGVKDGRAEVDDDDEDSDKEGSGASKRMRLLASSSST
ncbi:unnamed protein product, partial [Protopolystoma xenopodis]